MINNYKENGSDELHSGAGHLECSERVVNPLHSVNTLSVFFCKKQLRIKNFKSDPEIKKTRKVIRIRVFFGGN